MTLDKYGVWQQIFCKVLEANKAEMHGMQAAPSTVSGNKTLLRSDPSRLFHFSSSLASLLERAVLQCPKMR